MKNPQKEQGRLSQLLLSLLPKRCEVSGVLEARTKGQAEKEERKIWDEIYEGKYCRPKGEMTVKDSARSSVTSGIGPSQTLCSAARRPVNRGMTLSEPSRQRVAKPESVMFGFMICEERRRLEWLMQEFHCRLSKEFSGTQTSRPLCAIFT
jgi:hypothetical protein